MSNQVERVALIVGAGRGLGRAIALELGRNGYSVVVASRTHHEIAQVAAALSAQGGKATAIAADATQASDVERLIQKTLQTYGRIDVLVNCVGEALLKPTIETRLEDFQRILNSNLTAVFLACQAVMPQMIKQQGGHIINVASKVGRDAAPGVAAYTAAKAGVLAFSKSIGMELKPHGVKVTCLAPSPMNTPMRWAATPDWDRAKVIEPESVAKLVALIVANPDMSLDEAFPISPKA